jgi:hypothetical protein
MYKIKLSEILKVLLVAFLANLLFASVLVTWVTEDDIADLPKDPFDKGLTLFTFGLATFTTSGFVNTNAKSRRLKIVSAIYVLLVMSGAISYFFNF